MPELSNERRDELIAGVERLTPRWAGALVAAMGARMNRFKEFGVVEQASADREAAAWLADNLPAILTELQQRRASVSGEVKLFGPHGWLNGHRGLSEDSWSLESDPLENNEEYFAVPLYAIVDPFTAALSVSHEAASHPDDVAVERFAAAMKAKLAMKRAEGRSGWDNKGECSAEFLSSLLQDHVIKGDPVDVANLAMMLHQRGDRIVSHETGVGETEQPAEAGADRWPLAEAMKTAETWIQDYDLDDGESYHVPTETERLLMLDMVTGLFSDDEFIAILRRTFASPLPAPTDETQGGSRTIYVAVDHTGCIHSDEDMDRVISIAKANEASVKQADAAVAEPKPMINGGPTDQVKQAGGESLFLTLAMAAGGERVDSCIYAATRLMANICYSIKDIEQARAIVSQMALDAINELELNWPEREQLLADAKATIHREAGHG